MNNITLRDGILDDAETLVQFQKNMAIETENKVLTDELIRLGVKAIFQSDEKGFYLVAQVDDSVVGSLLITYEWSDWRNAWFWWIQSVYIQKTWRRKGIYSRLYDEVVKRCRQTEKTCGIRLYVEKGNAVAQKVYGNLGMHETDYLLYETNF